MAGNPFPFVGGSYTARSRSFDAQRCVNLYPEVSESGSSKSVSMLVGTPGLDPWLQLDGGGIRGALRLSKELALVVAGGKVHLVRSNRSAEAIGEVAPGAGPVSMASNGTDVMLASEGLGYWVDPTAKSVSLITEAGFEGAGKVGFLDGRFVWSSPGTGQFRWTELYSRQIDPLSFATAEGSPDDLVGLIVDHRELWLFGEASTEVFYSTGADTVFGRIEGAFIETGCAAPHSIAKMDNSVFWLASDERGCGLVLRAVGYQPQRISTHAVEYAIGKYDRVDDAEAFTYQQDGHSFYVLSFPSADRTWVYDAATNLWHEREWRDDDNSRHRIRPRCHMNFAGDSIVGDHSNGWLYRYDLDTYHDAGRALVAERQCQHIAAPGLRNVFFASLQVDMEAGVGLPTGQGADPEAMLQWSDDGGFTWSNERRARIGRIGERECRVIWRRLGRSRNRVFRVSISDPVKRVIVGAAIDLGSGES